MLTTVLVVALVVAAVLAVFTVLLWHGQERVVWQPPGVRVADPEGVHRLAYTAADGQPLFAFAVAGAGRASGAVLAFHGNADLAAWQVPWAREVARRTGAIVVLAEYRGYGGLGGRPTYAGSQADARAAYAAVREQLGVPPDAIVLFGHSLGSAVATELASALEAGEVPSGGPAHALVLQSPFTSVRDMTRIIAPALLLWERISRVHFDTERRVRTLGATVSVAHGTRDLIVPARMGRRVHEAAARRGELLLVTGGGHNDVPEAGGAAYWRWLVRAIGAPAAGARAEAGR